MKGVLCRLLPCCFLLGDSHHQVPAWAPAARIVLRVGHSNVGRHFSNKFTTDTGT